MARRSSGPVFTSSSGEAEVATYRPLSGLAIVAMVVGLLSALAVLDPLFWFLPVLGLALSAVALRRITVADPRPTGRAAALTGLGLSLVFAVAAPTDFLYFRWILRQEAREFALNWWFPCLARDEPHKAIQLLESPSSRQPLDDRLWDFYPAGSESRGALESFVNRRGVHALLLLGNRADVRYYATDRQWIANDRHCVAQTFAVTFVSAEAETQTFFVRVIMERSQVEAKRRGYWRVLGEECDFKPAALGGTQMAPRT